MASEKILAQKQSYVADLKAKLDASQGGVVFNYGGITVAEDTKLRKELREAGVTYEVVKNTLLKIAIKDTDLEGMSDKLEGTTALAIAGSEDHWQQQESCTNLLKHPKANSKSKQVTWMAKFLISQVSRNWLLCLTEKAFSLCCSLHLLATSAVWHVHWMQLKQKWKAKAKLLNLQPAHI